MNRHCGTIVIALLLVSNVSGEIEILNRYNISDMPNVFDFAYRPSTDSIVVRSYGGDADWELSRTGEFLGSMEGDGLCTHCQFIDVSGSQVKFASSTFEPDVLFTAFSSFFRVGSFEDDVSALGQFSLLGNSSSGPIAYNVHNHELVMVDWFFGYLWAFDLSTRSERVLLDRVRVDRWSPLYVDILEASEAFVATTIENDLLFFDFDGNVIDSVDAQSFGFPTFGSRHFLGQLTIDDTRGEVWVQTFEDGEHFLYQLGGFPAVPEPSSVSLATLLFMGFLVIARTKR